MDSSLLRAATHLALEKTPISLSEMREFILRHLLSDPLNETKKVVTECLFEAYMDMTRQLHPSWNMKDPSGGLSPILIPGAPGNDNILEFYEKNYSDGFTYGCHERGQQTTPAKPFPPNILPLHMLYYPREIVAQFATIQGYLDSQGREFNENT